MSALEVALRAAGPDDLDALVRLEDAAFPGDRLDRRAFRHALRSATIDMWVAERDGCMMGYAQVQRRRGSRLARLTSLAVDPGCTGKGVGQALTATAETEARAAGCDLMRLEVRADNARARALYERGSYRLIATIPDYYEDGCAAERFEKSLA